MGANLFLVMLASERDIREYVAEENFALWPAVMQGYDQPENLGVASQKIKEMIADARMYVQLQQGVAFCSALFPYLCEIKYSRTQEEWDMLMELYKRPIIDVLDDFDHVRVKIVNHDDVLAPTLLQLAQEFDLELA